MGIGAAIGVGASGAALGTAVGGPVGAAVGGIAGLIVGALAGGGGIPDASVPVESTGQVGSIDPVEAQGVPLTGGPSGGGPLAPSAPAGLAPIDNRTLVQSGTRSSAPEANLSRQRGNFPSSRQFSKVPRSASKASPESYTPGAARTVPPPTASRPPVEAVESTAKNLAANASRIPPPSPRQSGSLTSSGALRDAVRESWAARVPTLTTPGALGRNASGAAGRARTNAGPTPARPAAPSAQNTSAAPVEALENVKSAGERMAKNTADRFQGIAGAGRSNLSFKPRP